MHPPRRATAAPAKNCPSIRRCSGSLLPLRQRSLGPVVLLSGHDTASGHQRPVVPLSGPYTATQPFNNSRGCCTVASLLVFRIS
jgi:hypothetical protein